MADHEPGGRLTGAPARPGLTVVLEQVVDVDRPLGLDARIVVVELLHHLAAPVLGLLFRLDGVAGRGVGGRRLLEQAPEELDVEVALGALDGAVMKLSRGERVEFLEVRYVRSSGVRRRTE